MPASAELVDICQAHLDLLRHTFGEISSVIYLTLGMDSDDEPILVPIAQTPDANDLSDLLHPMSQRGALPASEMDTLPTGELAGTTYSNYSPPEIETERLVLPLMHQDIVLGVLVMLRPDRPWQSSEQQYLQTISTSLAASCFLDRQNQWLRQRLQGKQALQGEQSDVFHNLLHQFRNPLTAIGTFGKLLQKRLSQDDPNYRLADGIVRESQHLKELVTDFDAAVEIGDADIDQNITPPLLPESSEATAKPLLPALGRSLELSSQSLGEVLYPLITVTVAAAEERHRKFFHSPLETFSTPLVSIDTQALQEVIANLLDNAFKYAPSEAWVWLMGGLARDNFLGIVVGDTGPGIPGEDQNRLFERHYRGVQAQGNISGTGLGLAIAKDLIGQMGGTIELFSPASPPHWDGEEDLPPWIPDGLKYQADFMDKGTVFVVWLPIAD
ncbi:GAF domain-containing sensor histidine kinase [Leptothoe kymatousa]|uniref:histidine kinase n=1 Tax=Leptothoe kymatousa TAU-MAC 1615 TaxID=2364775 RepID=A0ABS5Y255_9CYAN|nr:ATP-binding protein [Leptothoe kymatousa]MBT9311877.1 GAF domain-containing protein [Leptothoe kymatousa TAU-MAC 1615]